jgi:hypothetical protein
MPQCIFMLYFEVAQMQFVIVVMQLEGNREKRAVSLHRNRNFPYFFLKKM